VSIIKGDFILTLHVLAAKGYLSIQYLLSTPDFLKSFFLVGVMILYDISRYQEETMGLQKTTPSGVSFQDPRLIMLQIL